MHSWLEIAVRCELQRLADVYHECLGYWHSVNPAVAMLNLQSAAFILQHQRQQPAVLVWPDALIATLDGVAAGIVDDLEQLMRVAVVDRPENVFWLPQRQRECPQDPQQQYRGLRMPE